ncbi:MFS transporter [Chondrinema litorale]|uniref:MFS transporter n=1 Tax=Chondrinema litorale TaxID=2994555 RepID=UPI0025433942|nr:MFS transporter [Chondrinema litorale]UZR97007.1 MFS transporter [Chondrinema litorale]
MNQFKTKTNKQPAIPLRFLLVLSTFLLALLLYIDRICISVAKGPIASELALSEQQMGWIFSAFALGYALFQVPSGIFADKFGPRKVLTCIVAIWSTFTALTGMAFNYISLITVRLLFGAGEAGAFPSMARVTYNWIPLKERGLITGINFSGSRLGAAFALPAVALMINSLGWRNSFLLLGSIGIVWAFIWWFGFRDQPEEHPFINIVEQNFILSNRQVSDQLDSNHTIVTNSDQQSKTGLTASQVLSSKNMWLLMGQYFSSNFTFFFSLTWLFPHIKEQYNLEAVEAGFYASAPLVFGAIGNWFSGWWIDHIYQKGKWIKSRRLPAITGFILAAIGLIGSVYMSTPLGAVIFLSIAIFGADMTLSPSWSACVDIGKSNSGTVSGTMNMAGNVGAFITSLSFPYLHSLTGSVEPFFFISAALNIVAVIFWLGTKTDQPIIKY